MKTEKMAKLVGVIAHFVYWAVFGGFNELQIDSYHMKQMLDTILSEIDLIEKEVVNGFVEDTQIRQAKLDKERGYVKQEHHSKHLTEEQIKGLDNIPNIKEVNQLTAANKLFQMFIMPLLLLTIRLELDVIFNMGYHSFFNNIGPSGNV